MSTWARRLQSSQRRVEPPAAEVEDAPPQPVPQPVVAGSGEPVAPADDPKA